MGIFDRFPYSSTHEMNLDFMLGKATEIAEDMQTVTTGMAQVQAGLSAISEKTEQATQAAAQAAQSASSIEGSVTAAEEAAEEAQMHNESAQTWANNAMTYKADCQRSATEAAASSSSAAQAATAAAASEDTVATYAQAANASAQSAANNNDSAHQYANQASASASNATFHSSNAQTAATNAQTAATNANTSATNASASADRAASLKTDVETLHQMCTTAVDLAANSAAQAAATKTDVENLVESLPEDFTDLNNTVNQLSDEIEVLKTNTIQNILTIPIKNASQSSVTNYRVYYFAMDAGTVFHAKTKNGTSINLLATYSDGTTGIISDVSGYEKAITLANAVKYIGYYLPAETDDVLYIYGDTYIAQRNENEVIKDLATVKNGSFSIDGYIKSTGGINSDPKAKRTDYIAVEQYDHLFVNTIIGNAGCSIAFFDQNKNFISAESETGNKTNYTRAIPQSAKYVIFSAYDFPYASAYLYVEGSVSREQIIDKQNISSLQTWSRKIFDTDAFGAFAKFGVCGDSLSVGYMDDSQGVSHGRNIYYSWGQVLARRYGNVCLNFGFSGATTKTWYNNPTHGRIEVIEPENLCQGYIVGLGANDSVNAETVGTAADINVSDYTQNADSFYGNYAKVIQFILATAPQAYVFAFTLPTLYATNLKNDAIRGVITTLASDRVFLVDLAEDYKYLYTSEYISGNIVGAHFNAIGYANIAIATAIAISDVMNKNHNAFIDLAFAPYGTNNVID